MPRLSPALIRQASSENPLLTQLLQVCRDLPSARNELRWLQEHAYEAVNAKRYASQGPPVPYADQGVGTPQEMGWPDTEGVKRGRTEAEHSHVPKESIKQGLGRVRKPKVLWRKVESRRLIKSYQAQMGYQIRLRQSGVTIDTNTASKVQAHDGRAGGEMSGRMKAAIPDQRNSSSETTHQKRAHDPTEKKRPRTVKVSRPQSAAIRSRSPDGKRELGLHAKTGEVVPSTQAVGNAQARAQKLLAHNVDRRSKGVPLQYIMGNQPFGTLDILCQRGVLIPRPETETYTEEAAKLLLAALAATQPTDGPWWQEPRKIRILDLCTGTGCIALLLHSILKPIDPTKPSLPPGLDLEIVGIDDKPQAVELARKNLHHNISQKLLRPDAIHSVSFRQADVLVLGSKLYKDRDSDDQLRKVVNAAAAGMADEDISRPSLSSAPWDMVIANPPYIAAKDYELGGKTEPSVRNHEPREALVPLACGSIKSSAILQADLFYQPLRRIAEAAGAQLLVMEVGDSSQAARVGSMVVSKVSTDHSRSSDDPTSEFSWGDGDGIRLEAWRDDLAVRVLPTETLSTIEPDLARDPDSEVSDRAIVVWSGELASWRCRNLPASNRPNSPSEAVRAKLRSAREEAAKSRKAMWIDLKAHGRALRDSATSPPSVLDQPGISSPGLAETTAGSTGIAGAIKPQPEKGTRGY
ncbi:hypothetical protein G647_05620 [Cladophialophora carrionii CBS 160.54]|uniref:Methyltransferase domain-containing protein n=1 Tax=Cladophialophora carrionii CBS 160.54 TaxID=1279043 RepID=V9DA61_9EURO|nr:uncharacterized protein G647_05620 [Cladophialophora carrionii CBS 160.54]ETI23814.1 hypothetical protein G647_05620 [Cladophialophora carrionii CBS 160.54]